MPSSPHLILACRAFGSSNGNLQWQELVICPRVFCSAIYEAIATQWQRAHVYAMVRQGDSLRPANDPSERSECAIDVHLLEDLRIDLTRRHQSANLYNMLNIAMICDQLLSHITYIAVSNAHTAQPGRRHSRPACANQSQMARLLLDHIGNHHI